MVGTVEIEPTNPAMSTQCYPAPDNNDLSLPTANVLNLRIESKHNPKPQ